MENNVCYEPERDGPLRALFRGCRRVARLSRPGPFIFVVVHPFRSRDWRNRETPSWFVSAGHYLATSVRTLQENGAAKHKKVAHLAMQTRKRR